MHFFIQKSLLDTALEKMAVLVPSRDMQNLFLSNVLLKVESPETLYLVVSDMESVVQIEVPIEGGKNGEVIIKAKKLSEIARKINTEVIEFSCNQEEVQDPAQDTLGNNISYQIVISGESQKSALFRTVGFGTFDFPSVSVIDDSSLFSLNSVHFLNMIQEVLYAISQEDNRYIYNGVCLSIQNNQITLIGTDGRRLSASTASLDKIALSHSEKNLNMVIHGKAIRELQKLLQGTSEFFIGEQNQEVFFKVGNAQLSSRLLDGRFPEYNKVIPSSDEYTASLCLDRLELLKALEQVMVMTEQPAYQTCFQIEGSTAILLTSTPDLGEAEVPLSLLEIKQKVEGTLSVWLNSSFLNDILRNVICDKISLHFLDSMKPIVVEDSSRPEEFISLIMPIGK